MKFEIYCDESQPDVFWSKSSHKAKYLLLGSVWIPAERKNEIKKSVHDLKLQYSFSGEIQWKKVSTRYLDFYKKLIDLFIDYGDNIRFRCIVVEGDKVNMVKFHQNDQELGFYKFYYQMIIHWMIILTGNASNFSQFCEKNRLIAS